MTLPLDHTLVKRIVGSALVVFIVTLLIAALTFYGVINMALARLCLILVFLLGVGGIVFSEWVWSQDRKMKIWVGIGATIVWAISLVGLDRWATRVNVSVAPNVLTFSSPNQTYTINVENASNFDVYAVALLILAGDDDASKFDFDISVPKESLRELESVPDAPLRYDISGMTCKLKSDGRLAYVFSIDHMTPHDVRHMVIASKADTKRSLALSVTFFETTESPLISSSGMSRNRDIPMPISGECGDRMFIFIPKQP